MRRISVRHTCTAMAPAPAIPPLAATDMTSLKVRFVALASILAAARMVRAGLWEYFSPPVLSSLMSICGTFIVDGVSGSELDKVWVLICVCLLYLCYVMLLCRFRDENVRPPAVREVRLL